MQSIEVVLYTPGTHNAGFENCQSIHVAQAGFIDFINSKGNRIVFSGSYLVLYTNMP